MSTTTKPILLRAHITSEEWERIRILALKRNQSTGQMLGEVLREFVDTHNPAEKEA